MASLNHIHSYRRRPGPHKAGNNFKFYMCVHPDCTSIISAALLVGKRIACACGRTFIIELKGAGRNFFQYAVLKCEQCSQSERAQTKRVAGDIMKDALSEAALPAPPKEISNPLPFIEIKSPISVEETILKLPDSQSVMLPFNEDDDSLLDSDLDEDD